MKKPHTQLYLLRHAEGETRYQRVFGGQIDMDLSERGEEQSQALAAYLKHHSIDAVYGSPMKRVQRTMAPFLRQSGHRPVLMEELREIDFGRWTGLSWAEVHEKFGIHAFQWLHQLEGGGIENAESIPHFQNRLRKALHRIFKERPSQCVAIFCHGGVIRGLLAELLDLPLPKMGGFDIEYGSLTRINCLEEKMEVELLNFTPWRDHLG